MLKCLLAIGITFTLFFFQEQLDLYPSFIALIGAGIAFLLIRPNPEEIFHDVEWTVLAFFMCFFVIVGGLDKTGLLSQFASKTIVIRDIDIKLYKVLLLWFSGILTSVIGSVPFTIVMVPVLRNLSTLGIEVTSLWWILAMGVGFGANALPISSAAGMVGISMSKKSRTPIDTKTWLFSGTIVTISCLIVVTILILVGIF